MDENILCWLSDASADLPDDPEPDGRRAHRRVALNAPIELFEPEVALGRVLDVSAGGMAAEVGRDVPVGEVCTARVSLVPAHHSFVWAEVVWTRPTERGFRLGLRFVDPEWLA